MLYFKPQQKNLRTIFLRWCRIAGFVSLVVLLLTSARTVFAQTSKAQHGEAGGHPAEGEKYSPPVAKSLQLVGRLELPGASKLAILRGQGEYLAVWRQNQTIQVWDVNLRRQIAQLAAPPKLYGITLTDDGKRLILVHSTSRLEYRDSITLWDVAKGREVKVLKGRQSWGEALHPQGRLAVAWSGEPQGLIQVVDAGSGKEISKFPLQEMHRYHKPILTFSPDGQRLAIGLNDVFPSRAENLVAIYDVANGQVLALLNHTPRPKVNQEFPTGDTIQELDFSPDGRILATCTTSMVCLWDVAGGKEVARLEVPRGCRSLSFSADSRLLATAVGRIVESFSEIRRIFESERTVKVWDTATGREVTSLRHDDTVWSVQFSPVGHLLATGSGDFEARLWETDSGKEVARLIDPSLYSLGFQADGKHLVTWSKNNVLQIWKFHPAQTVSSPSTKESHYQPKLTAVHTLEHSGPVWRLCFSPRGNLLGTAERQTVRAWEMPGGHEVNRWEEPGRVRALAFSPDGYWLASGGEKEEKNAEVGWITLQDLGKNEPKRLPSLSTMVHSLTFSRDSGQLAAGCNDAIVRIWEMATGKEMMQITHPKDYPGIQEIVYSPDGRLLATGSMGIFVWESTGGRKMAQMEHRRTLGGGTMTGGVLAMAFSPDGKWLATGGAENSVRLWEASTGREMARMIHGPAASGSVDALDFSDDGRYLVSGGDNHLAKVWKLPAGQEVARLRHSGPVTDAIFSPCGQFVASAEECPGDLWDDPVCPALVRVWEASSGVEVEQLPHGSGVQDLAFSPDGKLLASASRDGKVRIWQWPGQDPSQKNIP